LKLIEEAIFFTNGGSPLMKKFLLIAVLGMLCFVHVVNAADPVAPAPNGLILPDGYKDWRVISSSHRLDNQTLRVILGNDTAVNAARTGKTNPWPEGTILAKMAWKETVHPAWEQAIVPGEFIQVEIMVKDSEKYRETGGWGFARWKGLALKPYGTDSSFVHECFSCHQPVKNKDYVFTDPVQLP